MRSVTMLMLATVAACTPDGPAAPTIDETEAPPSAATDAARPGAELAPARHVFWQIRHYEDPGVVRHCQAVPSFRIAPSDFLRTGSGGDMMVHANGVDAYVMVSEAPARLDAGGRLEPPRLDEFEARWIGRGHLNARAWLTPDGKAFYSRNWTVDAVAGSAVDAGMPFVELQELGPEQFGPFDAAAATGTDRVRCRLHTIDFLDRVMANDVTVEPLRGAPRGKGGA